MRWNSRDEVTIAYFWQMNKNNLYVFFIALLIIFVLACSGTKKIITSTGPTPKAPVPAPMEDTVSAKVINAKTDPFLEDLLKAQPQYFDTVLQNCRKWKVQVIYTQIDRKANNEPVFKSYYFNYDPTEYFYPASTVKMPVALLALQKLHELSLPGLDKNSSLITEAAYSAQTPVYNDPSTPDGRPTVAHYVKKIFMVSDNDAFNRLYEMMGQQYINAQLHKMGYPDAEILHHLDLSMTPDENRHTNPIKFYDPNGKLLYTQPMLFNETQYSQRNDAVADGYYSGGQLVNHAMDFSTKNRFALEDLTTILRSVLFPKSVPEKQRFNLTSDDYKFVKQYMSQLPTESIYPPYSADTANYWPAYCKFLLYGSEKGPLPKNIRVFNKVGDAYGFLTDVAYIADFDKQIEFMLSARIYCNSDGVLNDDAYDYDTIGFPFMKHLGQVIYEYELQRPRSIKPDLTEFKMSYDK
jgi:beta-lactamase class A